MTNTTTSYKNAFANAGNALDNSYNGQKTN